MKSPKVSICIPVFNGEKFLRETLCSIINQTFKDFEIIISDDDSFDKSGQLIKLFLSNHPDILYKIVRNSNKGLGNNWNNCIQYSNGEYIKFLLQDDLLYESCLEEMVEVLEKKPEVGLVCSKRSFLFDKESWVDSVWLEKHTDLQSDLKSNSNHLVIDKSLFNQSYFLTEPLNKIGEPSGVMFRRCLVYKVGLFRTDLKQILDFEYWYRFLLYSKILIINKNLYKFRIHRGQLSFFNKDKDLTDFKIYNYIVLFKYFFYLNKRTRVSLFYRSTLIGRVLRKILNKII